ncbi:hypothetical protein QEN19_002197 [Hanseniaspora menglaensis]
MTTQPYIVFWKGTFIVSAAAAVYTLYKLRTSIKKSNSNPKVNPPKIINNITDLIGNTPIVKVESLSSYTGCEVFCKMELQNPGGSAKDRVALKVIQDAIDRKAIIPHKERKDLVFEGTSGSTGISIALICNALGLQSYITLPDDTSLEKLKLLESFGALIKKVKPASIVDPDQYVNSCIESCNKINDDKNDDRRGIFVDQFENELNWKVHFETTGPEIFEQMDGKIDCFISGVGTGGTIGGVARYLKAEKKLRNIDVVVADPQGSGFFNRIRFGVMYDQLEKEGSRRRHQVDTLVEGVGLNRITQNFHENEKYVNLAYRIKDIEALKMARWLSNNDGLFVGSSSCINACSVVRYVEEFGLQNSGKRIVFVACDSGSRHLSKFWKEALALKEEELMSTLDEL